MRTLAYALRKLGRTPGFTLTAIVTVSLTVAAVSAVLTLANAFYYARLPVSGAADVVEVQATRQQGTERGLVSFADYVHFRDAAGARLDLAAVYPTSPLMLSTVDDAREVNGAVVSANYFPLLRATPALGRFFAPDEDRVPDRDRVAVLGHALWQSQFGGSPDALGSDVVLNGVRFTVIGVAPEALGRMSRTPAEVYLPSMMLGVGYRWCDVIRDQSCTILSMVGRLREGTSVSDADAALRTLLPDAWRNAEPGDNSGVRVVEARPLAPGNQEAMLTQLLGAVTIILLLVCCANLAGLSIARTGARGTEVAIRVSLGASTSRLVRELTLESLCLSVAGGLLAMPVSQLMLQWLRSAYLSRDAAGRPLFVDVSLEPAVVGIVVLLAIGVGLAFGLYPALHAVRTGTAMSLRRDGVRTSARGAPRWLLGVQVAFALALIAVSGVLASSAGTAVTGTNFEPGHVALLRVRPRLLEYPPERAQAYLRDVTARLEAMPEVTSVGLVGTGVALAGFTEEVAVPGGGTAPIASGYVEVSPRYFETLGTPFTRGRDFSAEDRPGAPPVAVVSEELVRRLWPDRNPLGAPVEIAGRMHTVVGVVADVPLHHRAEQQRPVAYVAFWQNPSQVDARLQVRVTGDPARLLPAIARVVRGVDPMVPITELSAMADWLAGVFVEERLVADVISFAATLAVLLCGIGLYAALAFTVSQRTREIGIRQALGATRRGILAMVAREGMVVVVAGIGCGIAGALAAGRLLRHMVYGTGEGDIAFFGTAAAVLTIVGLLASLIPGWRAARVEPVSALRSD